MAASSHDPGVQDLQYHAFQSNPDNHHLYTSLASWASPQNLLQASSSSPAMFQRPGPPAHYPQYSAPLDYANLHPIQTSWPGAGPYRPESSYLEGFSSRPTHQHGYTEAGPSAPQSDTTYTRSPASSRVHDLLQAQPQTDFMPTQREHELQFSSVSVDSNWRPFCNILSSFRHTPHHRMPPASFQAVKGPLRSHVS